MQFYKPIMIVRAEKNYRSATGLYELPVLLVLRALAGRFID
jgi:hypothetical protein